MISMFQENGQVVRESDKREEVYFEKGQTKQLVEQWKNKQISPERDTNEGATVRDSELLQQGTARNLVQIWKCMDQENTPPMERRGLRQITPPADGERRSSTSMDVCTSKYLITIFNIMCLCVGGDFIATIKLCG